MFKDKQNLKFHFIGIGGVGMSGIAEIFLRLGHRVSGSDLELSESTTALENLGAEIFCGHGPCHVNRQTKAVVYSSAIDPQNPEIQRAKELGIPVVKRAEMLAELMRLKYGIAIAGTHGKTTTSSILAVIMRECKIDITHVIGGAVQGLGGKARPGKSEFIIAEADESDGSFLLLGPVLSIITNIDNDHLDFYGSEEKILDAFVNFSNKIPFYGFNALNAHDKNVQKLMAKTHRPYLSYGIEIPCDYCAKNVKQEGRSISYDLYVKDSFVGNVALNMPGHHNVLNSLGAIAISNQIISDTKMIINAIKKFNGVNRRFEQLYQSGPFSIVDDYAHHPTEIKETLKAAMGPGKGRIIVLFEPHRYSRTKACWDDFIECLKVPNKTFILPIYGAGEASIEGVSAQELAREIPQAKALANFSDVQNIIGDYMDTDTLFLTLGAGKIGKNIRQLVGKLP